MTGAAERPGGLFASLRTLAHDVMDLVATRSELAAIELAETRDTLLRSVALAVVGAVLALAALGAFTLWIMVLFWNGPRALAVGVLTAIYAGGAVWAIFAIRRGLASIGPLLGQTRAVLRKDYEALRGPRGDELVEAPPGDVPPAAPPSATPGPDTANAANRDVTH